MITRPITCIDENGLVKLAAVSSVISQHQAIAGKMKKMRDYYDGEHEILQRKRENDMPNAKLVHNYPRLITIIAAGYLVGSPVAYTTAADAPGQDEALTALTDAYKRMSAESVDAELAKHASIYGRGVEMIFADEDAHPASVTIDPREAFVVYDDTARHLPLFGVHYYAQLNEGGTAVGTTIHVLTKDAVATYHVQSPANLSEAKPVETEPHHFGGVPLLEYWNNDEEEGDYRPVISLIDAYNTLQSDRINDKSQFVDAIMVLTGATFDDEMELATDEDDAGGTMQATTAERIRRDKFIELPDNTAKLEYLTRQLDEAGAEILREALKKDIHKLSMVPDLSDENFIGNSSGVAMRYKLLGLEQLTKIKERWFREALKTRLKLFARFLATKGMTALDTDMVQIGFTRALPVNEPEIAAMIATLKGIVPDQLLLEQVPFITDAEAAMQMLTEQQEAAARQQEALFGQYPDANKETSTNSRNDESEAS